MPRLWRQVAIDGAVDGPYGPPDEDGLIRFIDNQSIVCELGRVPSWGSMANGWACGKNNRGFGKKVYDSLGDK